VVGLLALVWLRLGDGSRLCTDIQFKLAAVRSIPLVEPDQRVGCSLKGGVDEVLELTSHKSRSGPDNPWVPCFVPKSFMSGRVEAQPL
jgi:hypothetical protein